MSGPARTPGKVLDGRGSWRAKKRLEEEASVVTPEAKYPPCPSTLSDEAREEWYRIRRLYKPLGIFTEADRAVLINYCEAVADIERYKELLDEEGELVTTPNGALQRSPYTIMLREARDRVEKTSRLLGLNAADRSKVRPVGKKTPSRGKFGKPKKGDE